MTRRKNKITKISILVLLLLSLFLSVKYYKISDDFKVIKNIISFFNSESNEMNQTFNCKDNGYLFSSYNDDCEWL